MKHFDSLTIQKKRVLAIAGVSLLMLTIVGVIAYNQDSMFFANLFKLKDDLSEFSEVFDAPENWQPCQEVEKTAIATNRNDEPRYVRMKYSEYWRLKQSAITDQNDHTTTELPLTFDNNGTPANIAIINKQNEDKWELRSDGWYYYTESLAKDESTDSLFESVTMNCEMNTVGEIRYSNGGLTAESIPSDYADATYHIYITFQMSTEPIALDRTRLYNLVASKTNGVDTDINFANTADLTTGNGNGVNTLAAHKDDSYPVYYYRGEISDNNVLFNDYCWKIVRTTGGGGTKLIYSGEPVEDGGNYVCNNSGEAVQLPDRVVYIDNEYSWNCYYDKHTQNQIGYMNSTRYRDYCVSNTNFMNDTYTFGNDVEWDGEKYTLKDTVTNTLGNLIGDVVMNKHYYCVDGTTSCEKVRYVIQLWSNNGFRAVEFVDGGKIDDENGLYPNDQDSLVKKKVEDWFEDNMLDVENKLEDTIFCNDRTTFNNTAYDSKDGRVIVYNDTYLNDAYTVIFNGGHRNARAYNPSVDCSNKRDSFTKNETTTGNGKLNHKVGLITSDELTLSGMAYCKVGSGTMFLQDSSADSWTMTPHYGDLGDSTYAIHSWTNYCQSSSIAINSSAIGYRVRPVISMIYDTYVAGGDGTSADPYTLEW